MLGTLWAHRTHVKQEKISGFVYVHECVCMGEREREREGEREREKKKTNGYSGAKSVSWIALPGTYV